MTYIEIFLLSKNPFDKSLIIKSKNVPLSKMLLIECVTGFITIVTVSKTHIDSK